MLVFLFNLHLKFLKMTASFFSALPVSKVIDVKGKCVPIDLSVNNESVARLVNAGDFEDYVANYLKKQEAVFAYGGYNEQRNLYQRSEIFKGLGTDARNIHIGIDLWIKAGTPILAVCDGKIHSFNFNAGMGNYGPTIILEHAFSGHVFYTLYGHLSIESIADLKIGTAIKKGQKIGMLGNAAVNGDYAPHLHFQIIKDIGSHFGDYPGVCSKKDLNYYLENCPNPNLLLHLN